MTNRTTNIELLEWQTKIVLKALLGQEQRLREIVERSPDEDAVADASNDLVELKMVQKLITEHGLEAFGASIRNLSDDPI
ncbi:MAG: hypothetical protein QM715_20960 [Nibricoccus sp.]